MWPVTELDRNGESCGLKFPVLMPSDVSDPLHAGPQAAGPLATFAHLPRPEHLNRMHM